MAIRDGVHRARYTLSGRRDVVVPVVFQVKSFDDLGRPKDCTILYDDESINLAKKSAWVDGVHRFWIIYMNERDVQSQGTPGAKA